MVYFQSLEGCITPYKCWGNRNPKNLLNSCCRVVFHNLSIFCSWFWLHEVSRTGGDCVVLLGPIMVMNALFVDDSCPLCHDLLGPLTLAYFGRRQLFCLGPMATESPLDELCLNKMESMKRTPIHVYVHLADLGRLELQLAMCQTFPNHFNLDWRPRLPGPFLRRRCVQKQGAIRHQVGQTQPSGVSGASVNPGLFARRVNTWYIECIE